MSTPEIITVNSESLEAQIRELLPSQRGFGSELQASNVIMPIIDLTATAEGSGLTTDLARALSFGSQTEDNVENATSTVITAAGFFRFFGTATAFSATTGQAICEIILNDGTTDKTVWSLSVQSSGSYAVRTENIDIIVFLAAGHSLKIKSNTARSFVRGSVRQVATVTGQTVVPNGFVAE